MMKPFMKFTSHRIAALAVALAAASHLLSSTAVSAPPDPSSAQVGADTELNRIYQYFVPSTMPGAQANSGAYLWIPPATPHIRAVMIGIHNGLPVAILQNAEVRAVCRKHGIAQILMTPNGSEIGPVMLKDLNFDVTDPVKTAVYDAYLTRLADISAHPELLTAPIVPLAHSAYMDFPFDAAMRKPEQCLASIPIKSGMPDKYKFYAADGKARKPAPELCLRNVPLLFISSASQETVSWSAYPHGYHSAVIGTYRRDHDDNLGTTYEPRNELIGECWDMMSGHFDMLPRNYQFVADWLDAIATARLPQQPGAPLKTLTLRDGWLMNPAIPTTGDLPKDYAPPAPYAEFKGPRNKALWFPNESLAHRQSELLRDEPRREIELFTFLNPQGAPIDLTHGQMATMPDPNLLPHDDGLFTLITHHFTAPFDICTVKHGKDNTGPHTVANLLFPDKTTLPISPLPLHFDANGAAVEWVRSDVFKDTRGIMETRFTLKMQRHRLAPNPGFTMLFLRAYHEGDARFAAAGRTCQIAWVPQDMGKDVNEQGVTFPAIADAPASVRQIELKATSSAGLPIGYFICKGPGVIRDGTFITAEVPADLKQPIEVTIGAYQVGLYRESGGTKPSKTVYQTFHLLP